MRLTWLEFDDRRRSEACGGPRKCVREGLSKAQTERGGGEGVFGRSARLSLSDYNR
jgi:hypothetical protein